MSKSSTTEKVLHNLIYSPVLTSHRISGLQPIHTLIIKITYNKTSIIHNISTIIIIIIHSFIRTSNFNNPNITPPTITLSLTFPLNFHDKFRNYNS